MAKQRKSKRAVRQQSKSVAWNRKFRIPDALLDEARVEHVTDQRARTTYRLRAPKSWNLSGTVFPYLHRDTGEMVYARVRRDEHGEGEGKYHGNDSASSERILYCHPGAVERLKKKKTTIVLVESEKAVLTIEAWARRTKRQNIVALGMGGCRGWGDKKNGVLPDLDVCNGRRVIVMLDANVMTNAQVREALLELVAKLRARQCEVAVAELPQMEGVNGPDDLLAHLNGDALLAFVIAKAIEAAIAPYSEHALAERFAREHKVDSIYVPSVGWHIWDGQRWKADEQGRVELLVQNLCRTAASERAKLHEQNRIRSRRTREAVLREAQVHLSVSITELDRDVMLFNTPGGTVDLRTGKLREHRRDDFITKLAGATPEKRVPTRWMQFLREIRKNDKASQEYLQRVCGYCLTGATTEHTLFFLYGTGANGKSVFVSAIVGTLGDYAAIASMETFTVSRNPTHPTDLAGLRGARLVAATETEDGQRWAESKLKSITGGERIAARFMRQDFFEYTPQFKPLISGNHKPRLRNVDEAIRRRMNLISFNATFTGKNRDPKLAEKLRAEWGGILQWAVEGCLLWQFDGLRAPKAVLDATEDYLAEQDVFGVWLAEATEEDRNGRVAPRELYHAYRRWAEAAGEFVHSQNQFAQKLIERGYALKKSHGTRYVSGIRLRVLEGSGGRQGSPVPIDSLRTNLEPKFSLRRLKG